MEIQFQNTERDLRIALKQLPAIIRFSPELVTLAAAFPILAVLLLTGQYTSIPWFLIFVIVFVVLVRRIQAPLKNLDPQLLLPITMHLSPERIESHTETQSTYRPWSKIKSIRETRSSVLIFVREATFVPIPNSAFQSTDQRRQFIETANRYLQDARIRQELTTNVDMPIIGESLTANFKYSIVGLLELLNAGIRPPVRKVSLWLVGLLLTALAASTYLFVWDSWMRTIIYVFFSAAGFAFLVLLLSKLYRRVLHADAMKERNFQLTVSEPGLFHGSADLNFLTRWSAIREIKQSDRAVVFLSAPGVIVSGVPYSAFSATADRDQFVDLAKLYLRESQGLNEVVIDAEAVEETGNPYQPPIT